MPPPNVLAFDTCFGACSAAVMLGDGRIVERMEAMDKGHAERLVPMIRNVLADAGLSVPDLHLLAVTIGPGSFTGVRVGIAAAEGLSLAAGLPVAGATSLAVMARQALASRPEPGALAVAVDARAGRLYVEVFDAGSGSSLSGPHLLAPDEAARLVPPDTPLRVAGPAAPAFAEAATRRGLAVSVQPGVDFPSARHLARMAPGLTPQERVAPLYLRAPDAKPSAASTIALMASLHGESR